MKKGSLLGCLIAIVVAFSICAQYVPSPKRVMNTVVKVKMANEQLTTIEEELVPLEEALEAVEGGSYEELLEGTESEALLIQAYENQQELIQTLSEIEGVSVEELTEGMDLSPEGILGNQESVQEVLLEDEGLVEMFGEEELKWLLDQNESF